MTTNKNKINRIFCTGGVGELETYDWVRNILPPTFQGNFHCVRSEFQETKMSYPENLVVKVGEFKIGLINGFQVVPWGDLEGLCSYQRQLECDILISGFTHINSVSHKDGKYFINPGTMTGAFSPLMNDPPPTFMLLLINGDIGVIYLYELNQSTKIFDVSKIDINKSQ